MKSFLNDRNTNEFVPVFDLHEIEIYTSLKEVIKYNWDQLHETNQLSWLIADDYQRKEFESRIDALAKVKNPGKKEESEFNDIKSCYEELEETFFHLMDEWFELTKSQSQRKELYAVMEKAIIARNDVIQGDEFAKNLVRKYERLIDDISGPVKEYNTDKERAELMATIKMVINPKDFTVIEYHYLMETAIEINKQSIKNGKAV